jgi:hypothetical protein
MKKLQYEDVLAKRPALMEVISAACRFDTDGVGRQIGPAFKGLTREQKQYFMTLITSIYRGRWEHEMSKPLPSTMKRKSAGKEVVVAAHYRAGKYVPRHVRSKRRT